MKTAHELAAAAATTATQPSAASPPRMIPRSWVARLFLKFTVAYGRLWTANIENIEEQVVDEWTHALGDLSAEQIRYGLAQLERAHPKYPPTLFEFRNLCRKRGVNEYGLDYTPAYYRETRHERLLDQPRDEEAAKEHLAKMRAALRGAA